MAEKVDAWLLSEVRAYGTFNVVECFNCGSCTVSCELVAGTVSFPRRPLQYALVGLRDRLCRSLEPWLCHDCGDCSLACPRQAEPRESMATLRRYLVSQYDWTGLSARILRSKAWEIGSLSFVGILVLLLIVFYHQYVVGMPVSDFASVPMPLEHMFGLITYCTLVVVLLPALLLASHAFRMWWFAMYRGAEAKIPPSAYLAQAWTFVLHSVTHRKMLECPEKSRWPKHWLLALGTTMMLVIVLFFLRWFQTDDIYPIYHPQRWLGYLATIFMVYGATDIIVGRMRAKREIHKFSEFSDLTLPALLLLTAVSGIAVHVLRYAGAELATHYAFALHMIIAVPTLVIELPFGKWSHMIYRPLALYFQAVKERASAAEVIEELKAA